MSDSFDGGSSGSFDGGTEVSETTAETVETPGTELYTDEGQTELYDAAQGNAEAEPDKTTELYNNTEVTETVAVSPEPLFNREGEPVTDTPTVRDESFYKYDENGEKVIDWDKYGVNSEKGTGFDTEQPQTEVVMQEGEVFARYGSERGRTATDVGTEYSSLSLPYDEKTIEYHEYRVCKPISCTKGVAAENFGEKGGGTQYMFTNNINRMLREGTIERIK